MYLTDLLALRGSFTVTDSPGLSPDSMFRIQRAGKNDLYDFLQYT